MSAGPIIELLLCVALTGSPQCNLDPMLEALEAMVPPAPTTTTTTRAPSSSSTHRGMGSNVERWRSLVAAHFRAEDVERVLCLMAHESGGNPNAKNPRSSARGLMQILGSLWAPHYGVAADDLYDPNLNLAIARDIRDSQGWQAWSPYNRGLCR